MALGRWLLLIGTVVGLGCLQVAQRNALMVTGYAVGEGRAQVHAKQTEVSWAGARVAGLSSPVHLAEVAQERRLKLVAWSTLSAWDRVGLTDAMLQRAADGSRISGAESLTSLAALGDGDATAEAPGAD